MLMNVSLALLLAAALPANAAVADQAEGVLESLQTWLDGTRDLRGTFEQELLSGALGTGIEERGNWYLRRPGQLRFDYIDPETKVAVVSGNETVFWVEADDHIVRGRLDRDNDLLVTLLAGERPLRDLFEPSIDVEPVRRGKIRLRLVPLLQKDAVTELILTVPRSGSGLETVEVLDAAGNRMLYRFPRMRRNTDVEPGLFRFTPPAGSAD